MLNVYLSIRSPYLLPSLLSSQSKVILCLHLFSCVLSCLSSWLQWKYQEEIPLVYHIKHCTLRNLHIVDTQWIYLKTKKGRKKGREGGKKERRKEERQGGEGGMEGRKEEMEKRFNNKRYQYIYSGKLIFFVDY